MKITSQQAEKIFNGNQSFSQLGFTMLITRLKKGYINNPSPAIAQVCAEEINAFLAKFHSIMDADYKIIQQL